jgi:hypothetical protein
MHGQRDPVVGERIALSQEPHEEPQHLTVGVRECRADPMLRSLSPVQHATLQMERIVTSRVFAAMLLGPDPKGSSRRAPGRLAAKLAVVARVHPPQRCVLLRRELDVADPYAHRTLGDA